MNSVGSLSYAKLGDSTVPNRQYYCVKFLPAGGNSVSGTFASTQSVAMDTSDATGANIYYLSEMESSLSSVVQRTAGYVKLSGNVNVAVGRKQTYNYLQFGAITTTRMYDSEFNSVIPTGQGVWNVGILTHDQSNTTTVYGTLSIIDTITGNIINLYRHTPGLGNSPVGTNRHALFWDTIAIQPTTGSAFIGGFDTIGGPLPNTYGVLPQLTSSNGASASGPTRWVETGGNNTKAGGITASVNANFRLKFLSDGNLMAAYSWENSATQTRTYIRKIDPNLSLGIYPTLNSTGLQSSGTSVVKIIDLAVDSSDNIYCVLSRFESGTNHYHIVKLDSSLNIVYDFYSTDVQLSAVSVSSGGRIYLAGRRISNDVYIIYDLTTGSFAISRNINVVAPGRGTPTLTADHLGNTYFTGKYFSASGPAGNPDFGFVIKFQLFSDLVNSTFSDGSTITFSSGGPGFTTGSLTTFTPVASGISPVPQGGYFNSAFEQTLSNTLSTRAFLL
jgi:hypothetical protein